MVSEEQIIELVLTQAQDPIKRVDKSDNPKASLPDVASEAALDKAEQVLDFKLPSLLKKLYLQVANGGFGPGYGLIGVEGGFADVNGHHLVEFHNHISSQYAEVKFSWPSGILPICDWGGTVWSCVDCRPSQDAIITLHKDELYKTTYSLASWLEAWVHGVPLWDDMFEFTTTRTRSPFTNDITEHEKPGSPKGEPL